MGASWSCFELKIVPIADRGRLGFSLRDRPDPSKVRNRLGTSALKCPICNGEVQQYAPSCRYCGTRFAWPGSPAQPPLPHEPHNEKRVATAVLLLALLALSGFFSAYVLVPIVNTFFRDARSIYRSIVCSSSSSCNPTVVLAPTATYDQQVFMIFRQTFSSLSVNVTAVEQSDSNGYGPSYLLNGVTNDGYWYQVGLSWNWPVASGKGYFPGWSFAREVFTPSGSTNPPRFQSFSGTVNDGDVVLLSIYFSGRDVVMSAYDYDTGARASQSSARDSGSSYFQSFYSVGNMEFFTGLMTEWYHSKAGETRMDRVAYSVNGNPISSGRVCVDEHVAHDFTSPPVYSGCSAELGLDSRPQPFSFHGLNAYASSMEFVTGPS